MTTLKTTPDISEPRGRVSSGQTIKGWSEAAVKREVELQVAPLLEEIKALRADAARYRWLKEFYTPEVGRFQTAVDRAFIDADDAALDEAIDAAMGGN